MNFYDLVHRAVLATIEEGYVFENYLCYADEIKDGIEMNYTSDEWNEILKKAYENRGLDLESLLRRREEFYRLVGETLQEAIESKDGIANVTPKDVMEKLSIKIDRLENPDGMS